MQNGIKQIYMPNPMLVSKKEATYLIQCVRKAIQAAALAPFATFCHLE